MNFVLESSFEYHTDDSGYTLPNLISRLFSFSKRLDIHVTTLKCLQAGASICLFLLSADDCMAAVLNAHKFTEDISFGELDYPMSGSIQHGSGVCFQA